VREACRNIQSLDLSGAVLYTNVEPCLMCSFAIRQTGIAQVVYSRSNRDVGGANSKFDVLTDATLRLKFGPPQLRTLKPVERAPDPCVGMD
jgi:tRNA(adenine34) deaminase